MSHTPDDVLDLILALQLTTAWYGEHTSPPWWGTKNVTDPDLGGAWLSELTPATADWASLELALALARHTEFTRWKGATTAQTDRLYTLFHHGPDLDERLADWLLHHKLSGTRPPDALPELVPPAGEMVDDAAERLDKARALLGSVPAAEGTAGPLGLSLGADGPASAELRSRTLAATALAHQGEGYVVPHFERGD